MNKAYNIQFKCISLEALKGNTNLYTKFNDYFTQQDEIIQKLLLNSYIVNYQYYLEGNYIESVNERNDLEIIFSKINEDIKNAINGEIKKAKEDEQFQEHFKNIIEILEKGNIDSDNINNFLNILTRAPVFNQINELDQIFNLINPFRDLIILDTFKKGIEKTVEEKVKDIANYFNFETKYENKIKKVIMEKNYDSDATDILFFKKLDILEKNNLISDEAIKKIKEIDNENLTEEQKEIIKISIIQNDLGLRSSVYRKSTFMSIKDVINGSLSYLKNIDCKDKYLCYISNEKDDILISMFVTIIDKNNKYQEHMFIARNVKYFFEELVTGDKKYNDLAIKLHSFCAQQFSAKRIYFDPLISMFSLLVFKYNVKLVKNSDKFGENEICFYRSGQDYTYYIIVDNNLLKWYTKKGGAYYKYLKYKTKYLNLSLNNSKSFVNKNI